MRLTFAAALAALALPALGGCSKEEADAPASSSATPESTTLAAAIADAPGLRTVSTALKDTGLGTVFDGTASYTLFAPSDDAFGKLGDSGKTLALPEQRAAMAAVLRDHIVPGYLTAKDIDAAIIAGKGQPVTMTTMGDTELRFAKEGESIVVTGANGVAARFDGEPFAAGNGVAIPIDTVLKPVPATPTAG